MFISSAALFMYLTTQMCSCGSCEAKANSIEKSTVVEKTKTVKLKITGMTCGGCADNIHKALLEKNGIIENEVSYPGDVATIKYDPEKISEKEIIATIEQAGYKAALMNETEQTESKEKKCEPSCIKSCCAKPKSN